MSTALLALWNDIDRPAARAEYEVWHALEHVPERVGLPGFVAGTRYVGDGGYFTWYALESLAALQTPEYADVIAHPTPWSARMRPRLSAFVRRPCEQLAVFGHTQGAALTTLRATTTDVVAWQVHAMAWSAQAVDEGKLARVTLAVVPPDYALAYPVGGERIAAQAPQTVTVLAMLEHVDAGLCRHGAQWWQQGMLAHQQGGVAQAFTWQTQVHRKDLTLPAQGRLPPRLPWMAHYQPT